MAVKKIINQPPNILEEMLNGLTDAYSSIVYRVRGANVVAAVSEHLQVGLVSGGGSGHEPAHAGYVGSGMLQAAVCGEVFTSPTPDQIFEGIKAANKGLGVLLIVKNYSGDIMNFEMAKELAEMEDIAVEMLIVDDDIAVEDSTYTQGKRGVAGTVFVHKILGAAARSGMSLLELKELGEQVVANMYTLGVALTGATVPEVGKPGFTLAETELEFGVGIHGEPGYRRAKMQTSQEMASEILEKLDGQLGFDAQKTYALLVNGLGGTPLMEQYIFYHDVKKILDDKGVRVTFVKIGNYMTALEMSGVSLTVMEVKDEQWLKYLEEETKTIAW